jgi:hypothetical protein
LFGKRKGCRDCLGGDEGDLGLSGEATGKAASRDGLEKPLERPVGFDDGGDEGGEWTRWSETNSSSLMSLSCFSFDELVLRLVNRRRRSLILVVVAALVLGTEG